MQVRKNQIIFECSFEIPCNKFLIFFMTKNCSNLHNKLGYGLYIGVSNIVTHMVGKSIKLQFVIRTCFTDPLVEYVYDAYLVINYYGGCSLWLNGKIMASLKWSCHPIY